MSVEAHSGNKILDSYADQINALEQQAKATGGDSREYDEALEKWFAQIKAQVLGTKSAGDSGSAPSGTKGTGAGGSSGSGSDSVPSEADSINKVKRVAGDSAAEAVQKIADGAAAQIGGADGETVAGYVAAAAAQVVEAGGSSQDATAVATAVAEAGVVGGSPAAANVFHIGVEAGPAAAQQVVNSADQAASAVGGDAAAVAFAAVTQDAAADQGDQPVEVSEAATEAASADAGAAQNLGSPLGLAMAQAAKAGGDAAAQNVLETGKGAFLAAGGEAAGQAAVEAGDSAAQAAANAATAVAEAPGGSAADAVKITDAMASAAQAGGAAVETAADTVDILVSDGVGVDIAISAAVQVTEAAVLVNSLGENYGANLAQDISDLMIRSEDLPQAIGEVSAALETMQEAAFRGQDGFVRALADTISGIVEHDGTAEDIANETVAMSELFSNNPRNLEAAQAVAAAAQHAGAQGANAVTSAMQQTREAGGNRQVVATMGETISKVVVNRGAKAGVDVFEFANNFGTRAGGGTGTMTALVQQAATIVQVGGPDALSALDQAADSLAGATPQDIGFGGTPGDVLSVATAMSEGAQIAAEQADQAGASPEEAALAAARRVTFVASNIEDASDGTPVAVVVANARRDAVADLPAYQPPPPYQPQQPPPS
jgi:trimeric autotransporter adhesin